MGRPRLNGGIVHHARQVQVVAPGRPFVVREDVLGLLPGGLAHRPGGHDGPPDDGLIGRIERRRSRFDQGGGTIVVCGGGGEGVGGSAAGGNRQRRRELPARRRRRIDVASEVVPSHRRAPGSPPRPYADRGAEGGDPRVPQCRSHHLVGIDAPLFAPPVLLPPAILAAAVGTKDRRRRRRRLLWGGSHDCYVRLPYLMRPV
mmetsp:Transcript_59188/g.175912  ORF Transcript_59188/g.175912 Transcript_59188/m.175912 type:complete len:202 (+) Transcript_59188:1088-1693(+)